MCFDLFHFYPSQFCFFVVRLSWLLCTDLTLWLFMVCLWVRLYILCLFHGSNANSNVIFFNKLCYTPFIIKRRRGVYETRIDFTLFFKSQIQSVSNFRNFHKNLCKLNVNLVLINPNREVTNELHCSAPTIKKSRLKSIFKLNMCVGSYIIHSQLL